VEVLNKIDKLDAHEREGLAAREQPRHERHRIEVLVSAQTGEGLDALLAAIDDALFSDPVIETELRVPQSDGAALAAIEGGMVVHQRAYEGNLVRLAVSGPASLVGRLRKYRVRDEKTAKEMA
jgi:GTP-binding protein HflX